MAGTTKLLTPGGGGVNITPASSIASDVTVQVPSVAGTVLLKESTSGMSVPAFSAYMSAQLNVSNGTATKAPFNTIDFDTASCFNTSTYRFTPNVAGYYLINGFIHLNNSSGNPPQTGYIYVYKNGVSWKQSYIALQYNGASSSTSTFTGGPTISTIVYCNGSTDYIELYGYISSSAQAAFYASPSYFNGCLIRSA